MLFDEVMPMATQADVRRIALSLRELRPLITEAWRCQAPKDLALEQREAR